MSTSLPKLKVVDWVSLGVVLGFAFGLAEAIAWLSVRKLDVMQIVWAAPSVDCVIAVLILLTGALIAHVFKSRLIEPLAVYLACLLIYTPLRVMFAGPTSQWPVALASIVLAAIGSVGAIRVATSWPTVNRTAAMLAVLVIAVLIYATSRMDNGQPAQASVASSPVEKNVLVIVVDTLRADHLSLAGYSRMTTPHLDRFAGTGTIFDNAISTSSWTLPAHASLLTGLYPHEHHTELYDDRLPTNIPIISDWFSQHGYRTAAFSANTFYFSRSNGFGRGFTVFRDSYPPLSALFVLTKAGQQFRELAYRTHLYDNLLGRDSAEFINDEALQWIDREKRPFFAILNYFDIHDPYIPPLPYRNRYIDPKFRLGQMSISFDHFPSLSAAQTEQEVAMYDAALNYTDDQLSSLLSRLEERGVLRNTVVVITSDHGEEFGEHGFFTHTNALYSELIRVPLIIVSPGQVPSGVHISTPVSLTNIPSTLIELATQQKSKDFPQTSLVTLWRDPASRTEWPPPISELARMKICQLFPNSTESFQSVTTPEWHYIVGSNGDEQLFRVDTDPLNKNDLAGSAPPGVLDRMRQDLATSAR